MRKDITITVEPRETRGKNEARRLRVRGMVPAVVYGIGSEPYRSQSIPRKSPASLRAVRATTQSLTSTFRAPRPCDASSTGNTSRSRATLHVDLYVSICQASVS
jgi:ribosomal protein L25 (general stress protein Ctc)